MGTSDPFWIHQTAGRVRHLQRATGYLQGRAVISLCQGCYHEEEEEEATNAGPSFKSKSCEMQFMLNKLQEWLEKRTDRTSEEGTKQLPEESMSLPKEHQKLIHREERLLWQAVC